MSIITENINEYIKEIINASNDGKLVFFIGAGVSTISGYPRWGDVVEKFNLDLYEKSKSTGKLDSNDYLRIPQIYFDVKGKDKFNQILKNFFQVQKSPNEIHDKILSLNPKHIITTNYDDLIEKASSNKGHQYSIISQEDELSESISSRYLLKIHGDFRNGYDYKNIVLKEDDYLNYDQNYPLISNLMKTIIATHTIVFIGYGLEDYNVNIILNWVKTLQKDSYNKPVFIKTDPQKSSREDLIYYDKKGLKIIDAASLIEKETDDYLLLYNKVMDLILNSHERKLISNSNEAIEYIYNKTSPLFSLNYIRTVDFNALFDKDYTFEINGTIYSRIESKYDYLEDFFEKSKEKFNNHLSDNNKVKANEILAFFNKNGIKGLVKNFKIVEIPFEIENLAFESNFEDMKKFVEVNTSDDIDNYKKAFYLAHLGRWEDSYDLYSNLIKNTVNNKSHEWIYYLSQINRYRIYQSIKQLLFSKQLFKDDFLFYIDREMKNFNLEDLFDSMSFQFKNKYRILKFLSSNSFLYEDTVQLFNLTNKIRLEMSKNTMTFGLSNQDKITLSLYENLRFMYDNFLWVVQFNESKQYIKNSITLLIEKANYENSREDMLLDLHIRQESSNFELDYYYFVSISKNFQINDVQYWEQGISIDNIKFSDSKQIEEYLIRLADILINHFPEKGMPRIFYDLLIEEVKTAFYLSKYIKFSEKGLVKIIKSMLFHFPERDLNIGKCYLRINSLGILNKFTNNVLSVIEQFLYQQTVSHNEANFSEQTANGYNSSDFVQLIKYFKKDFISKKISILITTSGWKNENQLNYMYLLTPILNDDAKKYVLHDFQIKTIEDIENSLRLGIIDRLSLSHVKIIYEYLQVKKVTDINDKKSGIIAYGDNYMKFIGICYFTEELKLSYIQDYIGIDNEFDFLVQSEGFDFMQNFNAVWLLQYSEELLERISADPYKKYAIREFLKVELTEKKPKNQELLKIFLQYFI